MILFKNDRFVFRFFFVVFNKTIVFQKSEKDGFQTWLFLHNGYVYISNFLHKFFLTIMYRSLNSLFIRFSWNYWKNENKYKLEKERIGYCYKYREWHVCSINWRYVSINMKTTRQITLIFKLRSTFFVLNRLKKILETSFTCIFSCKNQPTQLKI